MTGLRDPHAADPTAIASEAGIDPADVDGRWEIYHSSHPRFAEERARELLAPAPGVELHIDRGTLTARGAASAEWVEQATQLAVLVPGVTSFDATGVVDPALEAIVTSLQSRTVCFAPGVSTLPPEQASALREIASEIRLLDEGARGLGRRVRLDLVGYADSPGTDELNDRLSRERAESVLAALGVGVLSGVDVSTAGAGVRSERVQGATPLDSDRCVTFRVEMVRSTDR